AEVDMLGRVWTIRAERMKSRRLHRVPLSPQAITLLDMLPRDGEHIFPGTARDRLGDMGMTMLVRRMGVTTTVHGFRSSFRDFCAEQTNFPREIAEEALAHRTGTAVELSYRRTDYFAQRTRLMGVWGAFIDGKIAI